MSEEVEFIICINCETPCYSFELDRKGAIVDRVLRALRRRRGEGLPPPRGRGRRGARVERRHLREPARRALRLGGDVGALLGAAQVRDVAAALALARRGGEGAGPPDPRARRSPSSGRTSCRPTPSSPRPTGTSARRSTTSWRRSTPSATSRPRRGPSSTSARRRPSSATTPTSSILRDALGLVERRAVRVVARLAAFAREQKDVACVGYTHFQAAQPTTVGKRACLWIQDLVLDVHELSRRADELRFLGCKGATGTQASFVTLFGGDAREGRPPRPDGRREGGLPEAPPRLGPDLHAEAGRLRPLGPLGPRRLRVEVRPRPEAPAAPEGGRGAVRREAGRLVGDALQAEPDEVRADERARALDPDDGRERQLDARDAVARADARRLREPPPRPRPSRSSPPTPSSSSGRRSPRASSSTRRSSAGRLAEELPFLATENVLMAAATKGGDRQELHERIRVYAQAAGDRLKAEGGENDLLDRIAADPAFRLTREEVAAAADPAALRRPRAGAGRGVPGGRGRPAPGGARRGAHGRPRGGEGLRRVTEPRHGAAPAAAALLLGAALLPACSSRPAVRQRRRPDRGGSRAGARLVVRRGVRGPPDGERRDLRARSRLRCPPDAPARHGRRRDEREERADRPRADQRPRSLRRGADRRPLAGRGRGDRRRRRRRRPGDAHRRHARDRGGGPPAAANGQARPPVARSGSWAVQAGAFASEENASRLRDRLAGRYPTPWLEPYEGLTRVKFGPYPSRADAEAARDTLVDLGLAGIVVPSP